MDIETLKQLKNQLETEKNELEKINYDIQLGEHSMREKESQVIKIKKLKNVFA